MKKALQLITLFFILSSSVFSQTQSGIARNSSNFAIVQSDNTSLHFKSAFSSSNVKTINVATKIGNFNELVIEGYGSSNIVGEPKLPVLKQLLEVPVGADFDIQVINFTIKDYNLKVLGINYPIIPAQEPVSKSANTSKIEFKYNKNVYATNAFIDRKMIQVIPVGIMRGVRIVRLEVSPVLYNPVANTVRIYENMEVSIQYKNADLNETERIKENTYSPYFEASYNKIANHETDKSRANLTRYPVKYVIVSDPMFKTTLQSFIQWKTKKGFEVIEAYTNDPLVGTTTTSIQKYLKGLYTAGTSSDPAPSFVLFVGDVAQIPAFSGTESGGGHFTDLYYCEYTGDKLPEVYYGRFSATTVAQLQPQIDKTLEYEQYLMPDPSFLNNAILVAGTDPDYGPLHGNGQISYGSSTYFNATNGIKASVYLYPAPSTASASIIQGVSAGACYVNYTAHGSPSGWYNPSFSTSSIATLQNNHKYPLMVGNCCETNRFEQSACFGEALLRASGKGAIGYIGASNTSDWDEDYWFGVGYRSSISKSPTYSASQLGSYDRTFHSHGEIFGEWYATQDQILNAGNLAVTQSGSSLAKYYWEIYHLMGDPSLMPYFSVPPKMPVTYPSPMPASNTTVNIQTDPYAYAAISFNGVLYGVALADASGLAAVQLSKPFVSGNVADVVVTKQNRQPYLGKLTIGNSTGIAEANALNNSLNIFPNPNNGVFTMAGLEKDNAIEIYDVVGKLVYQTVSKNGSVAVDLQGQNKGVYFYKVLNTSQKTAFTGKLLID